MSDLATAGIIYVGFLFVFLVLCVASIAGDLRKICKILTGKR